MSLASLLVLLQCRQRQCRQCSTNFQFFEWARERSFSEQTFFSSDVGCLFRWRWTVEVASSTLSVEAAFTVSPGRGDIHNVCLTVGGSCLQSSSTLSVEAAFTVSPGRGDIRDIQCIMSQYVLSCLVGSCETRVSDTSGRGNLRLFSEQFVYLFFQ